MEGSDAICQKYGSDYCCAKITVTKDGITDSYHACSPRAGIARKEGKFEGGGYSGTWECNSALANLRSSTLLLSVLGLLAISFFQ